MIQRSPSTQDPPAHTITKLASDIGQARTLVDMCRAVLGFAASVGPTDMLYLSLFDRVDLVRRIKYAGGCHRGEFYEPDLSAVPPLPMNDAPQGKAIRERRTVVSDDLLAAVHGLPRYPLRRDVDTNPPRSSVAVPVMVDEEVVGALELQSAAPAAFGADHVAMIEMAASLLAIATKCARQTDEAEAREQRYVALLQNSSDTTLMVSRDGMVLWVGGSVERDSGYEGEALVGRNVFEFIHPGDLPQVTSGFETSVAHGRSQRVTFRFLRKDGTWCWMESVATNLLDDPLVGAIVVNSRDVTQRVQVEQRLRRSESAITREREVAEAVLRNVPGIFYMFDANGTFVRWNQRLEDFVGKTADEMRSAHPLDLVVEKERIGAAIQDVLELGYTDTEGHMIHHSGEHVLHAFTGERIEIDGVPYVLGIGLDISDRERAAREQRETSLQLRQRVAALRLLQRTSEALEDVTKPLGRVFDELLAAVPDAFPVSEQVAARIALGDLDVASPGYAPSEDTISATIRSPDGRRGRIDVAWPWSGEAATGHRCARSDAQALLDSVAQHVSAFLVRWAAAKRTAELSRELRGQVTYLRALQRIDASITSNADLDFTLGVILDAVLDVLDVDAADVFLYDRDARRLDVRAARGIASHGMHRRTCRLGEGWPGQAALQMRPVHVADLAELADDDPHAAAFVRDGLAGLYQIPLVARGELHGVLGVLKKQPLRANEEWTEKAQAIAVQAALAIHASRMVAGLQRSNHELQLAYDRTIEGWARALELKDEETAGHSQRVTDLTVALAQRMGVRGEAVTHLRRGALLHDIGKMGVPDRILLKPGKLDAEEWEVMQRHTTHARDLLKGIPFLERALEIPYAHHERYDGSGYPRGLAGSDIPLAARIFAVVDVYDALTSDRPYRDAWSHDDTVEYLREQAGVQFDPEVVATFLELIQDMRIGARIEDRART